MSTRRLYLVILILAISCQQVCFGQSKPPVPTNGKADVAKLDPKLNIFKDALLGGSLQAAGVILFHGDPNARGILLAVLKQSDNSPARIAVCRALSNAQADKEVVKNVEEFLAPLLIVLGSENAEEARLAGEATLIFEYGQIEKSFDELLADATKPAMARVNAVRALRLRLLDMAATIKLIALVDDSDKQVSDEARKALESLGIELGENKQAREEIGKRIIKQGRESFLQNRLIREAEEKRRIAAELVRKNDSYLTLLARAYKDMSDDAKKGKFLAEYLGSSDAPVRLWALKEAHQWRKGTTPDFPREQLQPILIGLIADSDKDVRLRTADLLAVMGELIFARPLVTQLEAEQDGQVKTKLFVALGWSCWSAISGSEPDKLSPEIKGIRAITLKWARIFLSDKEDVEKVRNGAEVIEKLLKRNGLAGREVKQHLDLLLARYELEKGKSGGTLTGDLLNAMAGLCTENSMCGAQAGALYWSWFEKALHDETATVREIAVDGLANIDKAKALAILRDGFVNDSSDIVRKKIIALANAVGDGREDLKWLYEKIGSNSESKPAWQAMDNIFKRSDADTANKWVETLTARNNTKLTKSQKIGFLTTAVEKAGGENKVSMLRDARSRLGALYRETDQYDKAKECLDKLRSMATTPEQKTEADDDLLCLYFAWPKTDLVIELLTAVLKEKDLVAGGVLLETLDEHLAKPTEGVDPNKVVALLAGIKPPQNRGKWGKWLNGWQTRLNESKPKLAGKPKAPEK